MTELRTLQQKFMSSLLHQSTEIESHIRSTKAMSASERMNIYANAYRMRLKEALQTDYENLHAYLGDEQFDAVMDAYIDSYPSQTTSLRYFSLELPTMLQQNQPYTDYPELHELACIEQRFANSFDAGNATAVGMDDIASIPEASWPAIQFHFHPSLQIIACYSNAFALWKALSGENAPPKAVVSETPEYWVIWRQADLISHYRSLQPAEHAMLATAVAGAPFAEMCESLLAYYSEEETPMKAVSFLQSWVQEEMITRIDSPTL